MASEGLLKYGTTQLLFADHSGDFGAAPTTAANSLIIGTPTDVQIDLTGVAATNGSRASAKTGDLGATRAPLYRVDACMESASAPTDGNVFSFYWGSSPSSTAATGNPGGLTGSDAAVTYAEGLVAQLTFIGDLAVRNNVINIGYVGTFVPEHRYGILLVVNRTDQALRSVATAMDETHITLTPIILEAQ